MKDTITFKGNRNKWIDFTSKIKKERKQVWDIMELFIESYLDDLKDLRVTDTLKKKKGVLERKEMR